MLMIYHSVAAGYILWGASGLDGNWELCEHSGDSHGQVEVQGKDEEI